MDDDSNSGGEMVNISDVFDVRSPMSEGSSPPRSPENMARPSIIVPVKSKNLNHLCSKMLKYFSHLRGDCEARAKPAEGRQRLPLC